MTVSVESASTAESAMTIRSTMYLGETRARACELVAGGNLEAIPPESDVLLPD
jgi:hypothetical protein